MYNYNIINPANIYYRKYPQNNGGVNSAQKETPKNQSPVSNDEEGSKRKFPNGKDVAIDYTKNQVNIAQVIQDFRSTIAAINSPDDVKEDVEGYLALVEKETGKENPSREIVLSNLKNAARITDKYIEESLKRPSKVVQDWVEALFLQKVNLKADPDEINEEFKVKIPPKKSAPIEHTGGLAPLNQDTVQFSVPKQVETTPQPDSAVESFDVSNSINVFEETPAETPAEPISPSEEIEQTPRIDINENEEQAKQALFDALQKKSENGGVYETLKLFDRAIELSSGIDNQDLKSAIYFERAKVFDDNDYVELALIDYNKATKADDGNLRCHAHIKMGNIYDEYVQFDPAMDQYALAIESAEEVNNYQGKTRALRYMAGMFAQRFDSENTKSLSDLAIESALESKSPKTIAKTYLDVAKNYTYIGDDISAFKTYTEMAESDALKEDYDTLATNYMEASMLMDKKGNKKKAYALMQKSKEYQRLARLSNAARQDELLKTPHVQYA